LLAFAIARESGELCLLRQGLWALQVSLAACSAYLLYAIGAALLFSPAVPAAAVPGDEPPAARTRPLAEYDVIATRNLFDTLELAPGETAAEVVEEIVESQLDVRLIGTIAGGPGEESLATVQDSAQVATQVGVNDVVSGARVVRIERDRIILDNRGRLEEITFPEDAGAVPLPAPMRAQSLARAPGRPQAPAQSLAERLRRMTQQAEAAVPPAQAVGLLDQVRMLPSYDVAGGLEGLKVSWVQEGSPAASGGIQVGDLITELNGQRVTSPAEGLRIFRETAPGGAVAVEVLRAGSPVSLLLQAAP
jgi:type II secretion system protein C